MKSLIAVIFALSIAFHTQSQNYIEAIAEKTCQCAEDLMEITDIQEVQLRLGICILQASIPYFAELEKDLGIDKLNYMEHGEQIGVIVGIQMLSVCPETIIELNQKLGIDLFDDEDFISSQFSQGIITNIETDVFVSFMLKEANGKTTRFYWLTFANSSLNLEHEYESLRDKFVGITYFVQELFDHRINEYRPFYIIDSIEVIE